MMGDIRIEVVLKEASSPLRFFSILICFWHYPHLGDVCERWWFWKILEVRILGLFVILFHGCQEIFELLLEGFNFSLFGIKFS